MMKFDGETTRSIESGVHAGRERGSAFLWVFIVMVLGVLVVTASLVTSRQNVRDQVVTLERADGLAFASMAGEIAVAVVRENTRFSGVYDGPRSFSGQLNPYGAVMNYVVDLQNFEFTSRSLRVTVTPAGGNRPFVAVARLREDLSVGDWLVVDYDAAPIAVTDPSLPGFLSCAATTPRVLGVGTRPGGEYPNEIVWVYENNVIPDRIEVDWVDFLVDAPKKVVANTLRSPGVLSMNVTTPFPRYDDEFYPPRSVPYVLRMYFEGRVVDSCVVEVTAGRFEFRLNPLVGNKLCFEGDTAVVVWHFNIDPGTSGAPSVLVGAERTGGTSVSLNPLTDGRMPSGTHEFALPAAGGNKFMVKAEAQRSIVPMMKEYAIDIESVIGVPPCYLTPPAL